MSVPSVSYLIVIVSFILAAVFELIKLPGLVSQLRPEWLVLTLLYWLLRYPEKVGLTTACGIGLLMDVMQGSYLGIHMAAMSIIAYLVLTMHQRLKMFPMAQQAMIIFLVTGIQLMVVNTLKTQLSVSESGLAYLWQAFTSALIWPFVVIVYDRLVFAFR